MTRPPLHLPTGDTGPHGAQPHSLLRDPWGGPPWAAASLPDPAGDKPPLFPDLQPLSHPDSLQAKEPRFGLVLLNCPVRLGTELRLPSAFLSLRVLFER